MQLRIFLTHIQDEHIVVIYKVGFLIQIIISVINRRTIGASCDRWTSSPEEYYSIFNYDATLPATRARVDASRLEVFPFSAFCTTKRS